MSRRPLPCLLAWVAVTACRGDQALVPGDEGTPDAGEHPALAQAWLAPPRCDSHAGWCPGDDIPGWPTAVPDLSVLDGKPIVEFVLPNREVQVVFGPPCDGTYCPEYLSEPHGFGMLFGDCDDWECRDDESAHDADGRYEAPQWFVGLSTGTEGELGPLSLGWYWPDTGSASDTLPRFCTFLYPSKNFNFPPSNCGPVSDNTLVTVPPAMVFLSEVRPDRVRGLVYFDITGDVPMWSGDPVVYLMNFEVVFPLHGGIQGTWKDIGPEEVDHVHYRYYGPTYDEAWPWDSITDEAVRRRLYDLYYPYVSAG